jgi:hypothetical protein
MPRVKGSAVESARRCALMSGITKLPVRTLDTCLEPRAPGDRADAIVAESPAWSTAPVPLPRIAAAAVISMVAVVAVGCSDSGDGVVREQSTVAGRTQTVTVTSSKTVTVTTSKTVTAPPAILIPRSTGSADFRTPSSNILCTIYNDDDSGPSVSCLLREASWSPPPPRPANCEYDWIDSAISIDDGAVRLGACRSDFPWGCVQTSTCDAVVPWGGSIALGDRIRCTARLTGLECSDRSGGGFVVSREGYQITS